MEERGTQLELWTHLGRAAHDLAEGLRPTEKPGKDGRGNGRTPLDLGQSARGEDRAGSRTPARDTKPAKGKLTIDRARFGNRPVIVRRD